MPIRHGVAGRYGTFPSSAERRQLGEDIVALMREGVIETSPGRKYSLDEIGEAVAQAEQKGRQGKVFLVPGK
ncbi:zinc-binding dehydrogenase [Streptomyces sp. NPDC056231]|uniref:zinc-binding dehydrogenase n=1 Tax=Streptomyces sp. NPDC056231 TaxID=3345755 RepID=UPI003AAB1124